MSEVFKGAVGSIKNMPTGAAIAAISTFIVLKQTKIVTNVFAIAGITFMSALLGSTIEHGIRYPRNEMKK